MSVGNGGCSSEQLVSSSGGACGKLTLALRSLQMVWWGSDVLLETWVRLWELLWIGGLQELQ